MKLPAYLLKNELKEALNTFSDLFPELKLTDDEYNLTGRGSEVINIVYETSQVFFWDSKSIKDIYIQIFCVYARLLEAKYEKYGGIVGTKYSELYKENILLDAFEFIHKLPNTKTEQESEIKEHAQWLKNNPKAYLSQENNPWNFKTDFYHEKYNDAQIPIEKSDKTILQRYFPLCLSKLTDDTNLNLVNSRGVALLNSFKQSPGAVIDRLEEQNPIIVNYDNPNMVYWVDGRSLNYRNSTDVIALLRGRTKYTPIKQGYGKEILKVNLISQYLSCPVASVYILFHYYGLGSYIVASRKNEIKVSHFGLKKLFELNDCIKVRIGMYLNKTNVNSKENNPVREHDRREMIYRLKPRTDDELSIKKIIHEIKDTYSYWDLISINPNCMRNSEALLKAIDNLDRMYGNENSDAEEVNSPGNTANQRSKKIATDKSEATSVSIPVKGEIESHSDVSSLSDDPPKADQPQDEEPNEREPYVEGPEVAEKIKELGYVPLEIALARLQNNCEDFERPKEPIHTNITNSHYPPWKELTREQALDPRIHRFYRFGDPKPKPAPKPVEHKRPNATEAFNHLSGQM